MKTSSILRTLVLALLLIPVGRAESATATGFCNPWFPTPEGARWEYEEISGAGRARAIRSVVVTSVTKTASGEVAELRQTVREAARKSLARAAGITEVGCQNGNLSLTTRGAAQGKSGGSKSTGRVTAVIPGLPSEKLLLPGYVWKSRSRIQAQEGGATIVVEGQRESRVGKTTTVEVPAGTFSDVLLVETRQTLTRAGTPPVVQQIREWYVRGVGLVQRETRVAGGPPDSFTVEKMRHFSRGN
jgi:hypothetical protein